MASLDTATLGGGCFWCLEALYEQVRGVAKVVSGYAGGATKDPSYEEVCSDETGHAEVVQVTFDPASIPYAEILEIFFTIHDPTTLNRQGADEGSQYRSVIFYQSPEQKMAAEAAVRDAANVWDGSIVTQVAPLERFYAAEPEHQSFYRRNPNQGYCRVVISPKVAKFRQKWASKLKTAVH